MIIANSFDGLKKGVFLLKCVKYLYIYYKHNNDRCGRSAACHYFSIYRRIS